MNSLPHLSGTAALLPLRQPPNQTGEQRLRRLLPRLLSDLLPFFMLVRELYYGDSVKRGSVVHLHNGRELVRVEEVHQGNADAEAKTDGAWKRSVRLNLISIFSVHNVTCNRTNCKKNAP